MKRRLLLVDDQQDIAKALKARLRTIGFEVILASDSVQGLRTCTQGDAEPDHPRHLNTRRGRVRCCRAFKGVSRNPPYPDHFPDRGSWRQREGLPDRGMLLPDAAM